MHELMNKFLRKAGLSGYKRQCNSNLFKFFTLIVILIISALAMNLFLSSSNNIVSYEDEVVNTLNNNFFIDSSKLSTQSNYETCHELESMDKEIQNEKDHSLDTGVRYSLMQEKNQMFPKLGKTGIFVRTSSTRNYYASEIISAKGRLFRWISQLCLAQLDANRKSTTSTTISSNSVSNNNNNVGREDEIAEEEKGGASSSSQRRGIIYTGGPKHFKDIYQSIYALHLLHAVLPIEVYVNQKDKESCTSSIIQLIKKNDIKLKVECKIMSNHIQKYESKFHALLLTTFTDVLFLDADNLVVRDITNVFFDSPQYQEHGIILWPDMWGESCRRIPDKNNNKDDWNKKDTTTISPSFGLLGYSTNVLYAAGFGHLSWENVLEKAQETESGQFVIDLGRHRGLIKLGLKIYQDRSFFTGTASTQGLFYGDKDIFRFIFLLMKEPVYVVPYFPSYSVQLNMNNFNTNSAVVPNDIFNPNDDDNHPSNQNWIKKNNNNNNNKIIKRKTDNSNSNHADEQSIEIEIEKKNTPKILVKSAHRDNLIHYFPYAVNHEEKNDNNKNVENQGDDDGEMKKIVPLPVFFHQLKLRQATSFEYILSVDTDSIIISEEDEQQSITSVCMPFPSTVVIDTLYKKYLHTKYNNTPNGKHKENKNNRNKDTQDSTISSTLQVMADKSHNNLLPPLPQSQYSYSPENQQLFNGYTPLKLEQLSEAHEFKKFAVAVFDHVDSQWKFATAGNGLRQ